MSREGKNSEWKSHLSSLKASQAAQGSGLGRSKNTRQDISNDENNNENQENIYSRKRDDSMKMCDVLEESQTSWPDYSGIVDETHDTGDIVESSTEDYSNGVNNVAKILAFGGGDSVEVESFSVTNRSSDQFSSFSAQPLSSTTTAYLNVDVPSKLQEHTTPPRPPAHQRQPTLSDSPSTSKLNSQNKVVPAQIVLPGEKDGSRLCVSPTSSRKESDFGRKLLEAEGDQRREQQEEQQSSRNGEKSIAKDEWKEAQTDGGKRYYYNRRTRESAWKLPAGALLVHPTVVKTDQQDDVTEDPRKKVLTTDSTPPGVCSQRHQREAQELVRQLNEDIEAKRTALTSTGVDMFCIFCGKQDSLLDMPYIEHMSQCPANRNMKHGEALLAVLACLEQQSHHVYPQIDSMPNEQSTIDYEETVECSTCGRTFADEGRLSKHAPSCLEASRNKITPYDGRRHRILGTPMEHIHNMKSPNQRGSPSTGSPAARPPSTPNSYGSRPASSPLKRSPDAYDEGAPHTEEFPCPKCDIKNASKDILLKHLRRCLLDEAPVCSGTSAVQSEDHQCPFCAKRSQSSSAYSRHLAICSKKRAALHKPGSK